MKIAYLLASGGVSGGAKVVFQQAEGLARRGHRVTVVSPEPCPPWASISAASHEQASFPSSPAIASADVVVATFWTTLDAAARAARPAAFHLCQGLETDTAFYAAQRDAIEEAYRRVPRKLVVAPHLVRFLAERGFTDVADVGQTFDREAFRVPARVWREPPRILLPGIFEIDAKGVPEALEALRRLRAGGARFRVLRLSTEPAGAAERRAAVVDEYHRGVSPERVPALLARADLFVGPNHAVEGFGLPTLEALAAGLPAALSDTPSHREIAGDSALYFAPGDSDDIAASVARLLGEPETRRRLTAEGPERAARYRTSDVVDRLEAAFSAALPEREGEPR
ncbi:MAG TPA: glycosyltransferase family 4 protein [Thermoanaerobaculia bacterium]|nr:glycosyltransferase family 4 protein [Thermoanaerobaculia bacterium]